MKTNVSIIAVLVVLLTACNHNEPKQLIGDKLVGMWYENNKTVYNGMIRSLVFTDSGKLTYRNIQDKSADTKKFVVGEIESLRYIVTENDLHITSHPSVFCNRTYYCTGFHLHKNILTIDSFPEARIHAIDLCLQKAEQIPSATLDKETIRRLDAIFSPKNTGLYDRWNQKGVIPLTKEELQSLCPDTVLLPEIDFEQQSVIYAVLHRECLKNELFRNKQTGIFEYVIENGELLDHYIYAYGVFAISPNKIQKINPSEVLIY